jgi:hypothetical protein
MVGIVHENAAKETTNLIENCDTRINGLFEKVIFETT